MKTVIIVYAQYMRQFAIEASDDAEIEAARCRIDGPNAAGLLRDGDRVGIGGREHIYLAGEDDNPAERVIGRLRVKDGQVVTIRGEPHRKGFGPAVTRRAPLTVAQRKAIQAPVSQSRARTLTDDEMRDMGL